MTDPLRFTFAISSYDHVEAVVDGRIPIEDARPLFIRLPIPEMFRRFVKARDWDVSEMSFVQYGTLRVNGEDGIVGIPVFPSRLYRQTAIFVRSDRIREPRDLVGARLGIVGWANSAAVWARGLLSDMHGIRPADVTWYQGGVERPGRSEVVPPRFLPSDVEIVAVTDRGIEEMLWTGDLEGIIVPSPPVSVESSVASGGLVRLLYDDFAAAERQYREQTGCLPIMHVVAMDRRLFERDPDIARRIYAALDRARREYFARLADPTASYAAIPWVEEQLASLRPVLGEDVWPYGVEPNRRTLETYLRYLREQGLIDRAVDPEELFPEWAELQR
jgi:4,5-dihydroxyphthalate decarboxylase